MQGFALNLLVVLVCSAIKYTPRMKERVTFFIYDSEGSQTSQ